MTLAARNASATSDPHAAAGERHPRRHRAAHADEAQVCPLRAVPARRAHSETGTETHHSAGLPMRDDPRTQPSALLK